MHSWKQLFDTIVCTRFLSFNIFFSLFLSLQCSEVPKPRGVSLSRTPLYSPEHDFICFDNSKTIPFSQVNDDYCDCLDASDEPGTSACPHGVFYCTNAGHNPINIASSRVNDGICDCCDGTDEYATEVKCINKCFELAKAAREEALQREALLKAGKQLREQLSQQGIQEKQKKKDRLQELEKSKVEAESIKAEKEKLKNEAEDLENQALEHYRRIEEEANKQKIETDSLRMRNEAIDAFNRYDVDQNGKVSFSELEGYETFDKDKDGKVTAEEAKYFLNEQDEVDIEQFISDAWNRIEPYIRTEAEVLKKATESEDAKDGEDEDEEEHDEDKPEDHEDHENEDQMEGSSIETKESQDSNYNQYDEETKQLVDAATSARMEFSNADGAVRNLDTEIKAIKEYLEEDYGPDEEYAPLHGQCFEYGDLEYIYKLCPFDKTIQQAKAGSLETRLGSWGKWSESEHNKYESMLYERGQACWNGPQRSTLVKISCGSENRINSVTEPNKCEYVFEFSTPAACSDNPSQSSALHDEL